MTRDIMKSKMMDSCLWQRRIDFDRYGEPQHDDGSAIPCRRQECQKLIKTAHGREVISTMTYFICAEAATGDLIDGCKVLSVKRARGLLGGFACNEVNT